MITNANVDNSLTTVLECPQDKRYVIYTVHFCNTSDSVSENLTIFLNGSGLTGNTIIKDVVIPPGETFVLGTSKKLSNVDHYRKKGLDKQSIILDTGESLVAQASTGNGENVKAVANYAVLESSNNSLITPTPTPTPSPTGGKIIIIAPSCPDCTPNGNDIFDIAPLNISRYAGSFLYLRWDGSGSSHAQSGVCLLKQDDCIYWTIGNKTYTNKVVGVYKDISWFGPHAYFKISLESPILQDIPFGTTIFICGSSTINLKTPTPTPTNSATPSVTPSNTATPSVTPSNTATPSVTPTNSSTPSNTPSNTITPTNTPTQSVTPSNTSSPGSSPSNTPSNTPSNSATPTPSVTPTNTQTPTSSQTPTSTQTPTNTPTPSVTPVVGPQCDDFFSDTVFAYDKSQGETDLTNNNTIKFANNTYNAYTTKTLKYFNNSDTTDFGSDEFTIEFSIIPAGSGDAVVNRWYSREWGTAYNQFYIAFLNWPNLNIEMTGLIGQNSLISNQSFEAGKEYHVVLQRKNLSGHHSTIQLFVNGHEDKLLTVSSSYSLQGGSSNDRISIGHFGYGPDGYNNGGVTKIWGGTNDIVQKLRITKGKSRYNVNSILSSYETFMKRPLPKQKCITQSGSCYIYTHLKTGSEFTLSSSSYLHNGHADMTAKASARISTELGPGWKLASWEDFASFTKREFDELINAIGPCTVEQFNRDQAYERVVTNGPFEFNLGFIDYSNNTGYPSFLTAAFGYKPGWYSMRGQYLSNYMVTGKWFTTLKYVAVKKRAVTPIPSLTPTPTPSEANVTSVAYCQPDYSSFYNLNAFLGNAIQGSGTYYFDIGELTSFKGGRTFPTTKNSSHSYMNALFSIEMVSKNKTTNLETWRLTLISWPKSDGTLYSIDSSVPKSMTTSDAVKSASDSNLIFRFSGHGIAYVVFRTGTSESCKEDSSCANVTKPEHWFSNENKLITLDSGVSSNSGSTGGNTFTLAHEGLLGRGEWPIANPSGQVNNANVVLHRLVTGFTNKVQPDPRSGNRYKTTGAVAGAAYMSATHGGQFAEDQQSNLTLFTTANIDEEGVFVLDAVSTELYGWSPNMQYNDTGAFSYFYNKESFDKDLYIDLELTVTVYDGNNLVRQQEKFDLNSVHYQKAVKIQTDVRSLNYEVDVFAGDKVRISLRPKNSNQVIPNGSNNVFTFEQVKSTTSTGSGNLLKYWDDSNNPLKSLTAQEAESFIKAFLPARGLTWNQAYNIGYAHLGGLSGVKSKINNKGSVSFDGYTRDPGSNFDKALNRSDLFVDLFYIKEPLIFMPNNFGFGSGSQEYTYVEDMIPEWKGAGNTPDLLGRVIWSSGNLYAIEYIIPPYFYQGTAYWFTAKRDLNKDERYNSWKYIAIQDCTKNINPIPSRTPAIQVTPSPTPSSSPEVTPTAPPPQQIEGLTNPVTFISNNAGPWQGQRTGFSASLCSGPQYGNGTYSWSLTGASGSFPYWQGPFIKLRCHSSEYDEVQTWEVEVSGWAYCQSPTYTATGTKLKMEDRITFSVGAGTVTIVFN